MTNNETISMRMNWCEHVEHTAVTSFEPVFQVPSLWHDQWTD